MIRFPRIFSAIISVRYFSYCLPPFLVVIVHNVKPIVYTVEIKKLLQKMSTATVNGGKK